jgi:hypothetical protein
VATCSLVPPLSVSKCSIAPLARLIEAHRRRAPCVRPRGPFLCRALRGSREPRAPRPSIRREVEESGCHLSVPPRLVRGSTIRARELLEAALNLGNHMFESVVRLRLRFQILARRLAAGNQALNPRLSLLSTASASEAESQWSSADCFAAAADAGCEISIGFGVE